MFAFQFHNKEEGTAALKQLGLSVYATWVVPVKPTDGYPLAGIPGTPAPVASLYWDGFLVCELRDEPPMLECQQRIRSHLLNPQTD
jgi:hypothetical protein